MSTICLHFVVTFWGKIRIFEGLIIMLRIGEVLKQYRGNMSLRVVSDLTGISHTHIRNIELGYDARNLRPVLPSPEHLRIFANTYHCNYEELMEITGYLDSKSVKEDYSDYTGNRQLDLFKMRLKQLRETKGLSYAELALETRISPKELERLENSTDKIPPIETLYSLSYVFECTPDYIGGYTDSPRGINPNTPRPAELTDFLLQQSVMFQGIPLTVEDKKKINDVLSAIFMEVKKRHSKKEQA
jgi:HTH-type transcriptional regulator, competence development regulator